MHNYEHISESVKWYFKSYINLFAHAKFWFKVLEQSQLIKDHNINGAFFFPPFSLILLSRKWHMIGFFIPKASRSESFNLENLCPSSPFLCTCETILSSTLKYLRNVDMSSAVKSRKLPSAGIPISCSGMNFWAAETKR